jgi:NADPH2:quinone reductase
MKAVMVTAPMAFERVFVAEMPDPVPRSGEVVIDVAAADTNYPDLLVIEGKYQFRPPPPFSPGKSAAGRIAALGEGVTGFAIGDPVAAQVEYGAYAEKLRAPAANCFPIPDGVGFETAAALGLTYQTAHFALDQRARLQAGESVLVLGGSGGIGTAAIQLARAFGAAPVIASVRAVEDAAIARAAGADVVIETGDQPAPEDLRDAARAATGGRGVDVVIDPVGGAFGAAALRALAWCGRLVVIGFASGEIPSFRANYLLVKNISVLGLHWSDYRERAPGLVARVQADLFARYQQGRLAPLIERQLPFADFKEALRAFRDGTVQGKIILTLR